MRKFLARLSEAGQNLTFLGYQSLQITSQLRYSGHILTHTLDAIPNPTVSTATFKASRHVDTGSMHVTVVSPDLTLINIWRDIRIS